MKIKTILLSAFAFLAGNAEAQTTVMYVSTNTGTKNMTQSIGKTASSTTRSNIITLNGNAPRQSIDGFGYAITYSSAYNLLKMSKYDRTALLTRLYSKTEGYGTSYVRMSIGCSDFSSTEYTLCDKKGLENFGFHSDEKNYILPILKEIVAINPDVKIMAAPWTCPRWMKVESLSNLTNHNSWTDGHLNPSYRETYANYFVKFVQAMKNEGLDVYAVTPQNEPLNQGNCASLYMPASEEAAFVKVLAKAFHDNEITTKIYVFDHNFNYDDKSDQDDYPIKVYNALGSGYDGEELVVGSAYHDYGGDPSEMTDIHNKNSKKEVIFTEESIGTWNNGRDLSATMIDKMKRTGISMLSNWARAVMVWNLMLDTNNGPNLSGGCQTCYGAIDIDPSNYHDITYNNHFYTISHLSSVVLPGAVRISTSGFYASNMDYIAFKNPDGTYAIVFANGNSNTQRLSVTDGTQYMDMYVPGNSLVSARFGDFTPATPAEIKEETKLPYSGIWIIGADSSIGETSYTTDGSMDWKTSRAIKMDRTDDNIFSYSLTVGKQLNPDYVNFKFFGQAGWGTEFNTTGSFLITTESSLFGIGTGKNGHDDGNIYLLDGQTLANGDIIPLSIDVTDPYNVVLKAEKQDASKISEIKDSGYKNLSSANVTYDISGRRVSPSFKHGLYIRNGKKIIK